MPEKWDDKFDYLNASRSLYHNQDYWQFLVRDVWRIDRRPCSIVDFGCGFGWAGLLLMPMLAPGSDYTGIDLSKPLLEEGTRAFRDAPLPRQVCPGRRELDAFRRQPVRRGFRAHPDDASARAP